jgi:Family of unknown function (DUF6713)
VPETLFLFAFINAVLLSVHEVDSAFWKEWELFRIPGGLAGFLLLHIPLFGFIFYGLIEVYESTYFGLIYSLIMAAGGVLAFTIHTLLLHRGDSRFRYPASIAVLVGTLIASLAQGVTAALILFGRS